MDESGVVEEIEPGYEEFRTTNLVNSVLGKITDVLNAPQFVTSPVMRFGAKARLDGYIESADIIQVEEPWQFDYMYSRKPSETPIVYSSHNFEPELYGHLAENRLSKLIHRRVRSVERRVVDRADLVIVTSQRDERLYRREYGSDGPFHVAPNATDVPDLSATATKHSIEPSGSLDEDEMWALFVGSSHQPNIRAVEHLIRAARNDSFPPSVQLLVVGSVCSAFDEDSLPDNVFLQGFVEDLETYLEATDIALNPITSGAGSNIKIPTYLSYRLPVVTTDFGARGFPIEDETHVVIADVDEFGDAIRRLRENPTAARSLGERGRQLVESELNWPAISSALFERIRTLDS